MQTFKKVLNEMVLICIDRVYDGTSDILGFFLDHGTSLPPHAINKAIFESQAPSSLMKRFLDLEPKAAISPRALTYAASRGFTDVIRQMLDSGIAPDARRPDLTIDDIRDSHQFTALYEAVTRASGVGKWVMSIWRRGGYFWKGELMLNVWCRERSLTPFRAAKRSKNLAVTELLEPCTRTTIPGASPSKR
jgi:hypothetical protein